MTKSALLMLTALAASPLMGQNAQQIADNLHVPALKAGDKKLQLPKVAGAKVEFLGADYEEIIDSKGNIRQVTSDTPVNVSFKVTKNGEEALSKDYELIVPAATPAQGGNPKPAAIPAILQWKGGEGSFALGKKITLAAGALKERAQLLAKDIKAILPGCEVEIVADGKKADITFAPTFNKATAKDGKDKESYTLETTPEGVFIRAESAKGLYWGSRTLLQILSQTKGSIPCGKAHDFPRYPLRGFVFDIARTPYSLEDLRNVIDTMSWYKMNDLHLVINNNYIFLEEYVDAGRDPMKEAYSAFRLESKVKGKDGTPLTAQDIYYTKKEFRELIDYAKKRGVNIVPEFDTPGHALSFTRVRPELIYQGKMGHPGRRSDHLDAGNPATLRFAAHVLDEYLQKDPNLGRPVLDGCVVHVGADEFYGDAEAYRSYADGILKHVLKRGYTPRIWGSLTHKPGKTPVVAKGVQMNLWSSQWQDPIEAMKAGYQLINTNDGLLYIVPYANYYRMDTQHKARYENWAPNNLGGVTLPSGHPQLIGAAFALWNDYSDLKHSGYGIYDIWPTISGSMDVLSQKMWGPAQAPDSFEEHRQLAQAIGKAPGCTIPQGQEPFAPISVSPGKLPYELGKPALYPSYHLTMEVELDAAHEGEEQTLLSSPQGELLATMKDGTIGFRRNDAMEFSFGGKLPTGKKVKIELIGQPQKTELLVDGQPVGTMVLNTYLDGKAGFTKRTEGLISTFILPLQTIGSNFHGKVYSLSVKPLAPQSTTQP